MKKISVIIPNYNSEKYISQTLNSVINQTYKNWEVILIDDCSNKKTKKILQKFKKNKKIKIFFLKKNRGAAYCRNFAIKKSKCQFIAFLDSDDLWKKDKLQKQLKFMGKNNLKFSYTNYLAYFENKKITKRVFAPKKISFEDFIYNTSIATSTIVVKRDLIKDIYFTPTKICEDYFFKCLILKKVGIGFGLKDFLTTYKVRKNSLQSNKFKNLFWIWIVNSKFNKFSIMKNFLSVINISISSFKRYGLK